MDTKDPLTNLKQTYLCQEIILKGYSSADFSAFLETRKTDGCDIDKWTLEELKFMVIEFIKMEREKTRVVPSFILDETMNLEAPDSIEIKGSDEDMSFQDSTMKQWLRPVDNSISLNEIDLTTQKPTIIVERVEEKRKKIFQTRLIYTLFTEPFSWRVERRESDFTWLIMKLRKEFPDLLLPWPEKKLKVAEMQLFIKGVVANKSILKSRFLRYFLSYTNPKKFYEKKRKEKTKKNIFDHIGNQLKDTFGGGKSDKSSVKKNVKPSSQNTSTAIGSQNVSQLTNTLGGNLDKSKVEYGKPDISRLGAESFMGDVSNCRDSKIVSLGNLGNIAPNDQFLSLEKAINDHYDKKASSPKKDPFAGIEKEITISKEQISLGSLTIERSDKSPAKVSARGSAPDKKNDLKEKTETGSVKTKQSQCGSNYSTNSGEIDLHLFLEDLKEVMQNNQPLFKKAVDLCGDIGF